MKKASVIAISVSGALLAVVISALVIFNISANKRADSAYDNMYDDYTSLRSNIENTKITVLENGNNTGTYTLEDLGILDRTLEDAESYLSGNKLYDKNEFHDLSLKEKTAWCSTVNTDNEVSINASDADLSKIIDALNKTERTKTENAYVFYENEAYHITPEIYGSELNTDTVREFLNEKLSEISIDSDNPCDLSLDITDCDCYILPDITSDSDFDFDEIYHEDISGYSIDVIFHNDTVRLSGKDIEKYMSVDKNGKIKIDSDGLHKLAEGWAETYKEENVPFLFDSYIDGVVPIDFVKCSYAVNTDSTVEELISHLLDFDKNPVNAVYDCYDKKGNAFDISATHVEVDIKNQHLVFYKNGELVVETDVVTGKPGGHETPTGLFHAYDKQTDRWLIGADYCVFVDYWVRIYGHYGLHDANWRSEFGGERYLTNGSHGCVNIPNSAMAVIFENIENGDPVLVH